MKYKLIILLVCAANVVYGQASEDEGNINFLMNFKF